MNVARLHERGDNAKTTTGEGNSNLSKLEDIPEDRTVAVFKAFCHST